MDGKTESSLFGGNACDFSVSIYADEIQEVTTTDGEKWMYMGAIYERSDKPILEDLESARFWKEKNDWMDHEDKNNTCVHWTDIGGDANKRGVASRWLHYLYDDSANSRNRKFYFSVLAINVSNLNLDEFGTLQQFGTVYNRFFRGMLISSLKKFFGQNENVVIDHIYHEQGQQEQHPYFDWHTILKVNKEKGLNCTHDKVEFLPKDHRTERGGDRKSNIVQLCDSLLGMFKDLHCGVDKERYKKHKQELLQHAFIRDVLIERIIRKPENRRSSFGYYNRFNIALFPKIKSLPDSADRQKNNYYDLKKIRLRYMENEKQARLF